MKKAIELNADMAELDVQETADGEMILLHDKTLKRTGGVNLNIWEASYNDLKNIEVGSWYEGKFQGESIPKLSEVIDLVKGKMGLNIELKTNGHEKKLADLAVEIVKEKKFENSCIFTSFNFKQVDRVKEIDPSLKVGYIISELHDNFNVFEANIDLISVYYGLVDENFIRKAKENNKEIHVWTVNDEDEMRRLIGLGVNSILTDYPDKLRKVLSECY
jgi:glycerophosphoryl diester phosphodiesterase